MKRPLIGITLDSEEAGDYSAFPWLAVRQNYAGAVERAETGVYGALVCFGAEFGGGGCGVGGEGFEVLN